MRQFIIIEWKLSDGLLFAHFPEPFRMAPSEWEAFANLFDRIGFRSPGIDGIRMLDSSNDTARHLADGLMALGYSLEHRGDVPASIMKS